MLGLYALLEPLPHPHPGEVVVEVLGGYAAQLPVGLGLELLVVVVDRLDVGHALADPAVVADGSLRLPQKSHPSVCGWSGR